MLKELISTGIDKLIAYADNRLSGGFRHLTNQLTLLLSSLNQI